MDRRVEVATGLDERAGIAAPSRLDCFSPQGTSHAIIPQGYAVWAGAALFGTSLYPTESTAAGIGRYGSKGGPSGAEVIPEPITASPPSIDG
jgi:hypothetical protein